jgi:pimeloyl-ACP methyl ester carboxylesterase
VNVEALAIEYVSTRLGRLAFRRLGSGPVAVLWHSMFVDSHTWDRALDALATDRTLIVVDGPGYGRSDPLEERTTMSEAVGAASDLVTSVGAGAVDWVGNAWGGHIGIELAAAHPDQVRSLVAISSPTEPNSAALGWQIRMLIPIFRLFGAIGPVSGAITQGLLTDASRRDALLVRIVTEGISRPTRRSYINSIHSFVLDRPDISGLLPQIHRPALFVTGDDRAEWSPEQLAASAALTTGARTVVVADARTLVPLEQPTATTTLIRAFWAEQRTTVANPPRPTRQQ